MSAKSERVAEALRADIIDGTIPGGARLRQVEVAERLGVSTTPVREAFAMLVREGLVVGDEHKGLAVFCPTSADLAENYAIRAELESLAAEHAIPRLTGADIAALEQLVADEHAFHRRLYERAGMPKLASLIDDLRAVAVGWGKILTTASDSDVKAGQHEAMLDACRLRDVATAVRLIRDELRVPA